MENYSDVNNDSKMNLPFFLVLIAVVILLGASGGFFIGNMMPKKGSTIGSTSAQSTGTTSKAVGVVDKTTFKDQAEGILREGGLKGEGNFHLERPGGESQNAYLTSTTVDLNEYIGKKVRVWGATYSGEKAGWLMDVGLVEVIQ